jgi:hypothetical protein
MKSVIAKLIHTLAWRVPGHGARILFGFSLAEHGSMLDLIAAARLTKSPERGAAYLRHMLDESRHARMFAARSSELRLQAGKESFGYPVADFENLFELLGEVRFLAFVHKGEKRGRQQFELYRDWFDRRGDRKSSAMFAAIVRDEMQHELYTYELLVQLAGSKPQAEAELRAVAMWEAWRTWRRAGRFLAEKVYFLAMLLIYCVAGPFFALKRLVPRASTGMVAVTTPVPARTDAPISPHSHDVISP